jgi:hypothetical protein
VSTQADNQPDGKPLKRGEAAWQEAKERIAERNKQARKAGKQRRAAYESQQEEARRAAESRRSARLLERRRTP